MERIHRRIEIAWLLLMCVWLIAAAWDATPVVGTENFLTGYSTFTHGDYVNIVVEIPAGTNAKWEVSKSGEKIEWEITNRRPRVVHYLPYPGNYGMIPGTLLPEDQGGDGDPLDVILLSDAIERGRVVPGNPIGVLRLLDDGERDDKILAVSLEGPMAGIQSLAELDRRFPGITTIIETWFVNYKGPGRIRSEGFAERVIALSVIREAAVAFERSHSASETKELE